jgi:acylphosphatase
VKQIKIVVTGKVQGVFFRASAKEEAEKLGLKGYARNKKDGTVEILAQGEGKKVSEFLDWCKEGPVYAKVETVQTKKCEIKEGRVSFEVF